ncbi:MAG: hypothetical protein PF508_05650 [Spirochaeta sp.]|nr:hypothetical protein [Spirochaeta sp.]
MATIIKKTRIPTGIWLFFFFRERDELLRIPVEDEVPAAEVEATSLTSDSLYVIFFVTKFIKPRRVVV